MHPYHLHLVDSRSRLSRYDLRRHQIHHHFHPNGHGREESVPRDCLRGGERDLHFAGYFVHGDAPDQAKVGFTCESLRLVWLTGWKTGNLEITHI